MVYGDLLVSLWWLLVLVIVDGVLFMILMVVAGAKYSFRMCISKKSGSVTVYVCLALADQDAFLQMFHFGSLHSD